MRIACLHTAERNIEVFEAAYAEGVSVVVLAQASMAAAAQLVRGHDMPLTSPASAFNAAITAAETTRY